MGVATLGVGAPHRGSVLQSSVPARAGDTLGETRPPQALPTPSLAASPAASLATLGDTWPRRSDRPSDMSSVSLDTPDEGGGRVPLDASGDRRSVFGGALGVPQGVPHGVPGDARSAVPAEVSLGALHGARLGEDIRSPRASGDMPETPLDDAGDMVLDNLGDVPLGMPPSITFGTPGDIPPDTFGDMPP